MIGQLPPGRVLSLARHAAPRRPAPEVKGRRDEISWPDARLVRACLRGREDAWAALLEKYKNLIFSIPIKQGIPRDDAADVFQRVCLLLLAELKHLRQPQALPMWLIRVTAHECARWRRQEQPYAAREPVESEMALAHPDAPLPDEMLARIMQEQRLREAVTALPPRCRQLIHMLFFEHPAQPYQEVARSLGLATGSIGFIRGRCLRRLRHHLEKTGFR
jgi:RNA polymerase sigma factor (sigma-70 family)